MKNIVTSSGHEKHYPHKVYCFRSLIFSLQELVMRTGFMQQCESTRCEVSEEGLSMVVFGVEKLDANPTLRLTY